MADSWKVQGKWGQYMREYSRKEDSLKKYHLEIGTILTWGTCHKFMVDLSNQPKSLKHNPPNVLCFPHIFFEVSCTVQEISVPQVQERSKLYDSLKSTVRKPPVF